MKNIILNLGIVIFFITLISCNKNEVKPLIKNTSYDNITKTLIEKDFEYNGTVGDLYITEKGQKIYEIDAASVELSTKAQWTFDKDKKVTGRIITCPDSGNNCDETKIGGDDVLVIKTNGLF